MVSPSACCRPTAPRSKRDLLLSGSSKLTHHVAGVVLQRSPMSAHPLFSHFFAAAVHRRDEIAADASRSSEDAADTHPAVN